MRRLAAIDIGTNTIRMLVAEAQGGRRIVPVARRRAIVGLGRRLRESGRIGEEEFAAALRVLREFRREMGRAGVVAYRACGTACLREAGNRAAFLEAAAAEGIDIEVVGPAEEARLASARTVNPEAYEAYLKGYSLWRTVKAGEAPSSSSDPGKASRSPFRPGWSSCRPFCRCRTRRIRGSFAPWRITPGAGSRTGRGRSGAGGFAG